MTIYVLSGFNNYYNRIVKKFDTISEYEPYATHIQQHNNFVPNDNVSTQVDLGTLGNQYNGEGDYLLAVNEQNEIVSRWFIIESVRDRAGQYTLTLHRDLVADHYDEVLNAPMFIEKATINNIDNPLLFNGENMSFNQIKKDETLLRDDSGVAWIVGYYGKDTPAERLTNVTIETNSPVDVPFIDINQEIENWRYYSYSNLSSENLNYSGNIIDANYYIKYTLQAGSLSVGNRMRQRWFLNDYEATGFNNSSTLYKYTYDQADIVHLLHDSFESFGLETLNALLPAYFTTNNEEDFLKFRGQTIKAGARYFDVEIYQQDTKETIESIVSGNLYNDLTTIAAAVLDGTPNSDSFTVNCVTRQFKFYLTERFDLEANVDLSSTDKLVTEDAPYNIFAIPFGEIDYDVYVGNDQFQSFRSTKEIAIATARAIQKSLQQGSYLYDLQLLPYCPIQEEITIPFYDPQVQGSGVSRLSHQQSEFGKQYSPIMSAGDNILGFVYYVPKETFSFNIDYEGYAVNQAESAIEKKINDACDKWRLCSPNYSNYFDFSAEKNNGVSFWNVDCSYKPYNPYIHINPNFDGLYGKDYNDPRGLVLGGNFSLSAVTDAWEQYEIQNKNFQLTFDRQIQNLEVQHKYQRMQEIVGGVAGVGAGAAGGGLAGSAIMPGIGTAVGAAVGGISSLAGMIGDIAIGDKLRNEALDYTKDLFGYQLGNIQALPNTLSKVSSFNENNKLFPTLEYYTCTDIEKEAFANKLAYNGMSIGVIGKIKDYIYNDWTYTTNNETIESKNYIKGQLIRINGVEDDYHIVNALSGELNKGIYIKE